MSGLVRGCDEQEANTPMKAAQKKREQAGLNIRHSATSEPLFEPKFSKTRDVRMAPLFDLETAPHASKEHAPAPGRIWRFLQTLRSQPFALCL